MSRWRRPFVWMVLLALAGLTQSALADTVNSRATTPADFVWQWPLPLGAGQDVVRIVLTPAIYAQITRADLRDLAAFNGANQGLPFGPTAQALPRAVATPAPAAMRLPMFRIPRAAATTSEGLQLHIERDADGRLRQLHAEIVAEGIPTSIDDWLLDLSNLPAPVRSLQFDLPAEVVGNLNARIEIAGSNDLQQWQVMAPAQAVLSLHQGEFRLQRLAVMLPYLPWRYLKLRRLDADLSLPLAAVTVDFTPGFSVSDQRLEVSLQGAPVADLPGVFEYRLAGPFPIERAAVELAERNALATIHIETRDTASQGWREQASGTAFRLASAGAAVADAAGVSEDIGAAPFELTITRDRIWRLRSEPALAKAPILSLGYKEESFVLLAQGAGPYRLVAGSIVGLRPDYPLQVVMSQLAAQHGRDWQPDAVEIGAGLSLSGAAALAEPPPPLPYRQWLLWGVLLFAAALIVVLAVKLLGESKAI